MSEDARDLARNEQGGQSTIESDGKSVDAKAATVAAISSDYKVRGKTDSPDGAGVLGHNTATSGAAHGVEGATESSDAGAAGVHGQATHGSGATYGVEGVTKSNSVGSAGVRGYASGTVGVRGKSDSVNAVQGVASADNFGGVYGENTATSGTTAGVAGRNYSPDGAAVYADAQHSSGVAVQANGTIKVTETIYSGGDVKFSGGTRQRTAGPVAKASISSDATIDNAVNVDSVTWDSSFNRYVIKLTGIWYYYKEYVATVTSISSDFPVPRTTSASGDLLVYFDDSSKHDFHLAVHELPNGTETTGTRVETTDTGDLVGKSN